MYCGTCGKQLLVGAKRFCTECGANIVLDQRADVHLATQIDSPEVDEEPETFEAGHYALGSNLKSLRYWDGEEWSGSIITDSDYATEVLGLVESLQDTPPRYVDESVEVIPLTEDELGLQAMGIKMSESDSFGIDWQGLKNQRIASKSSAGISGESATVESVIKGLSMQTVVIAIGAIILLAFVIGRGASSPGGATSPNGGGNSGSSGHYEQRCRQEYVSNANDTNLPISERIGAGGQWVDKCRNYWVAD